jgi:hypothetical protein
VALQSLKDLGLLTYRRCLDLFRHMVGLLGRVISPSQGLYLHKSTTQKDADKHPCLDRDSNPRSQQPTGQDPRLRPHGHCDGRYFNIRWRKLQSHKKHMSLACPVVSTSPSFTFVSLSTVPPHTSTPCTLIISKPVGLHSQKIFTQLLLKNIFKRFY